MYYAFLMLLVVEYVRPGNHLPVLNLLQLNTLIPLVVLVGTFLGKQAVSAQEMLAETNTRLLLALLTLVVCSFAVADVTMSAFNVFTTVLGYALFYWVINQHVTTVSRLGMVLKLLIVIHLVVAALNPQLFSDTSRSQALTGAPFLGDGNDYALSLNIVIPFSLFFLFESRKAIGKVAHAVMLLALVVCVIITQSRGGTLGLIALAVYYWSKSERKVLTAGLTAVALVLIMVVAPPEYFQRMETIGDYENNGSAQGRITAWKAGARMAMSNPLIGVGAGQFPINYTRFAVSRTGEPETRWKTAHSIYFLILGELGLPGLGLLLAIIITNITANRRLTLEIGDRDGPDAAMARQLLTCLSASMLAFAVSGAFLSAVYYPHMFVLTGICSASRRLIARTALATDTARVATPTNEITYHWALRGTLGGGRATP
jgi:putative inorganic carbon (hco3(-)) transporter